MPIKRNLALEEAVSRRGGRLQADKDDLTTDGHREVYVRRLLDAVEAGDGNSQRSLAGRVGIALGLTNLLLKRVVHKGWVRVSRIKPNRVRYLITPAGIAEKARMTRNYLRYSVDFYLEARARVSERLLHLSSTWPEGSTPKEIVFWRAGEVAEIGYVCLQDTDLRLVAVVDESRRRPFFGLLVIRPSALTRGAETFGDARIVVMSFDDRPALAAELERVGIDPDRVFWI